jgi:hypothetical protein
MAPNDKIQECEEDFLRFARSLSEILSRPARRPHKPTPYSVREDVLRLGEVDVTVNSRYL